ncbi:MAG TPA: ATP-binding protein [Polyangiaceae bacterium]|jgi:signal transduction histidine kinase|nr:ATP-binding protein [Polyangiaceae bacterium]
MSAKVLFVDDDESNLIVCREACGDEFSVLTAESADAALEILKSHEVGAIIADQRMPGTTGVALLERVHSEYPDTVRLLITAYSDIRAAIDAINCGHVRRYLKKPWLPEELRNEVRDALDAYRMKREREALDIRLRETERVYALGVVAASIGHELKTPIGWITNNLAYMQREMRHLHEPLEQDRLNALLDEVNASLSDTKAGVERLLEIVHGIETASRISVTDKQLVDLSEVLRLSLRLVSSELRRGASLEVNVVGAPKVRGSNTKLGQVMLNLLVNAIQALSLRPREENAISVRLRADDSQALFQVADNGPGVPEASEDRIFDPFFTTKDFGSGLGLAISRRIADEAGGQLSVSRDAELGGACFSLKLPLAH